MYLLVTANNAELYFCDTITINFTRETNTRFSVVDIVVVISFYLHLWRGGEDDNYEEYRWELDH